MLQGEEFKDDTNDEIYQQLLLQVLYNFEFLYI